MELLLSMEKWLWLCFLALQAVALSCKDAVPPWEDPQPQESSSTPFPRGLRSSPAFTGAGDSAVDFGGGAITSSIRALL